MKSKKITFDEKVIPFAKNSWKSNILSNEKGANMQCRMKKLQD